MTYRLSPKARFLTMTSVAALLTMGLPAHQANALCLELRVAPGLVTTNCTLTTVTGYEETVFADKTTVNVGVGAVVDNSMAGRIAILVANSGNDTVNNSGKINGLDLGVGMLRGNNNVLNNNAGGTISATQVAVSINTGQDARVANAGTITGGTGAGVYVTAASGVTIDNLATGTIRSTNGAGVHFDSVATQSNTLKNRNVITGGGVAVGVLGGAGDETVENVGTITGGVGNAIDLGGGDNTLRNGGIDNIAVGRGTISGNVLMGAGNDTVHNYGTINGGVDLGEGVNTFINYADATVAGSVRGGKGQDTVTIAGKIDGGVDLGGGGNDRLTLQMGMSVGGALDGGMNGVLNLTGGTTAESTQTLKNSATNFESLVTNTPGKWVLDNDYVFLRGVALNSGELNIADGRTLTVINVGGIVGGGILSGQGTVRGSIPQFSGTIRPGDGTMGTLTVTGNVTVGLMGLTAVNVEVSVGPGSLQTKLAVGENVTLGPNGTLRVSIAPGFYNANASYDVITAGGALNGRFGSITWLGGTGTRFTQFKVDYAKAKTVRVLVEKINYATVGNSYNQRQAGDGLFRGIGGNVAGDMERVAQAFEALTTDDAYRAALDSLSGDVYPVMQAVQERMAKNFRDVAGNRAQLFLEGTEVWGDILSTNQTIRSDGNGDQSKGDMYGAMVGIEQGFGYAKIGVFGGYGQGSTNLNQHLSSSKNNQIGGGAYAGVNYHGLVVSGQFSYAQGHNEVERHIAVGPSVQRNVNSKEKVRMLGGNASIGYEIDLGGVSITPAVGVDFTSIHSNGFEEKGNGGDVGLEAKRRRDLVVSGEAGLRISASWNLGVINIAPYVSGKLSWQVVGNSYRDRDLAFQGNPNETGFNVRSADVGKNRLVVGGGLAIGVGMVKLELGYSQDVNVGGSKEESRNFTAGLGFRW